MVSNIIVKESKTDYTFVIGESFKRLSKKDSSLVAEVKALIDKHNTSKEIEARAAIIAQIEEITKPGRRIEQESDNRFELDHDGNMYLKGTKTPISEYLTRQLLDYIKNDISVDGLIKFWQRLLLNPDNRVQEQLYGFLENNGHPITPGGYFLAYKSVNVKRKFDKETGEQIVSRTYDEDTGELLEETYTQDMEFVPMHNGAHGMKIKVGEPITMPREECDSDPNRTCSAGLHVGNMDYVGTFGSGASVILECLISPTDVVAVPTDYNNTKMRTCKYYPIAITNGENKAIFLEEDYDEHQKGYLEEQMSSYKDKAAEAIKTIEDTIAINGDVLDSLY
jgi:hypothetical protein